MMSTIDEARRECANYVNGQCLGVTVFNRQFRQPGACSIHKKRCSYFEKCVKPGLIRSELEKRRRQDARLRNRTHYFNREAAQNGRERAASTLT